MVRIRYTENSGVLTSKPLLALDKLVVVQLDTVLNTFKITNQANNETLATGTAVDTISLKKAAKNTLKQFGVVFQDEVRRRVTVTANNEVA